MSNNISKKFASSTLNEKAKIYYIKKEKKTLESFYKCTIDFLEKRKNMLAWPFNNSKNKQYNQKAINEVVNRFFKRTTEGIKPSKRLEKKDDNFESELLKKLNDILLGLYAREYYKNKRGKTSKEFYEKIYLFLKKKADANTYPFNEKMDNYIKYNAINGAIEIIFDSKRNNTIAKVALDKELDGFAKYFVTIVRNKLADVYRELEKIPSFYCSEVSCIDMAILNSPNTRIVKEDNGQVIRNSIYNDYHILKNQLTDKQLKVLSLLIDFVNDNYAKIDRVKVEKELTLQKGKIPKRKEIDEYIKREVKNLNTAFIELLGEKHGISHNSFCNLKKRIHKTYHQIKREEEITIKEGGELITLAKKYKANRNFLKALELYSKAESITLKSNRAYWEAKYNIGYLNIRLGKYQKAQNVFHEIINYLEANFLSKELNREFVGDSYNQLANIFVYQKIYKNAEFYIKKSISIDGNDAVYQTTLFDIYALQNLEIKAEKVYKDFSENKNFAVFLDILSSSSDVMKHIYKGYNWFTFKI